MGDGEHHLVAILQEPLLHAPNPGDHLIEGLGTVVGVGGIASVLGHPDRPAPEALVLLGKLPEALRLTKLVQVGQLYDGQIERLGEN